MSPATRTCQTCHGRMPHTPPSWQRTFCSNACSTADRAARQGEVDEMAVVRLLAGTPVTSTKGERLAAVAILTARGHSASRIAARLHTTERSIVRYRAELTTRKAAA